MSAKHDPAGRPRQLFPHTLKDSIARAMKPLLKQYGRLDAELILAWPYIAGPELSERATPKSLDRRGDKTTLTLGIASGSEFLVQYHAPELLARIEAHFGYPAVHAIAVRASAPRKRSTPRSKQKIDATADTKNQQ